MGSNPWKREDVRPPPPLNPPLVVRIITAICVMLRCEVWRTNLFTVVSLFTMPSFIALWQRLKKIFKIEFKSGRGTGKQSNQICKLKVTIFLLNEIENCSPNIFRLFSTSPHLSKYRYLCLFYVLLRLYAWCYAVKYEEQICS